MLIVGARRTMTSSRRSYDITDFDHMSHDKEYETNIDTLPEADQQGVLLDVDHDDEYSMTKYSVNIPEKKSSAIFIIQAEDDYISDRQCICCNKRCMCFLVFLFFTMASGFAAWLAYNYLVQSPQMMTSVTAKSGNESSNMSVEEQTPYISTAMENSKTSTSVPETAIKVIFSRSFVNHVSGIVVCYYIKKMG